MDDQRDIQTGPTLAENNTSLPPTSVSKSKRKGWLIAGSITAAILLLGGMAAAIYTFWYQNPDKVITDSIVHLIQTKSLTYSGSINLVGSTQVKIELQGAVLSPQTTHTAKITFPFDGKDHTLEAQAISDDKGDLYLKARNIDSLTKIYRDTLTAQSTQTFDALIAKINDQWIKVSAADLTGFNEDAAKKQTCISDTIKKYKDDNAALSQIADVYQKNKFMTVDEELESKDGSVGYRIKLDNGKANTFAESLKHTNIHKTLSDCGFEIIAGNNDAVKENRVPTHVELWADRWNHHLTRINVHDESWDGKTQGTFMFQPKFDEKVTITAPDQSTTLSQLQAEIQELLVPGTVTMTPSHQEISQSSI